MKLSASLRRVPALVHAGVALIAAWAAWIWFAASRVLGLEQWFDKHGWGVPFGLLLAVSRVLGEYAGSMLVAASVVIPVALVTRIIARKRVGAGLPDPIDRGRAWTAGHARLTRAALVTPAALWFTITCGHVARGIVHEFRQLPAPWLESLRGAPPIFFGYMASLLCATALAALGVRAASRSGLRAFLAPTVIPGDATSKPNGRVAFDAVAVTAETRMAVGLMAVLSVAAVVGTQALRGTALDVALAAYVAVAIAGVLAFRRASRVAIGADGVFVTGTSRSRFFAYKDLDSVRASGSDIELVRKGRVTLRLQLHGEDATHKTAIVARIGEAIDAVKAGGTAAVGDLVSSASDDELARLAEGTRGYRTQSVTREQLWSVVEGPEHDAATRTAAARALASTGVGDKAQNVRLRVAAEKSAEPGVRVALEGLLEEDEEEATEDQEGPGELAVARRV